MSHEIKDAIQSSAKAAWMRANRRGLVAGATGVGKTKIAIDAVMDTLEAKPDAEIVIATPTEDLRDRNWPEEFIKWLGDDTWKDIEGQIQLVCYVSLDEVRSNRKIDLLILDEGHHLTINSAQVFKNNIVEAILALSATPPDKKRDEGKWDLLNQWAPVCFIYDINQAADEGAAAEFQIIVIKAPLDSINKNVQSGPKAKPFLTTEMAHYTHLNNVLKRTLAITGANKANAIKFATIRRAQFIYNLRSKTKLAAELLNRLPAHLRIITFCGSIAQSRELFGKDVYNSKDKHPNMLDKFKDDLTMKRIGVVNAVDKPLSTLNLSNCWKLLRA
jgi:superfamily II DNA or RNA helicase